MAKISYHDFFLEISRFHDFITILCHVSFTILSEQYSQTNFSIIKTKTFKATKYEKKNGAYLGQSVRR